MNGERDDEIGTLLRDAGARRDVPDAVTSRVRAEVHAHWRRAVAPPWHRRPAWLAAAAVVVLGVGLALLRVGPWRGAKPTAAAVVQVVDGPSSLRAGAELGAGRRVETGAASRLALRLDGGAELRLDERTSLRLVSARRIELERGSVYFDSGSADPARPAGTVVATPFGEVEHVGTQFEVRLSESSMLVRVREGRVLLHGEGERTGLDAGREMRVDATGIVDDRSIGTFGPSWDWVERVIPPLDIDGRPLREFLSWAAREGGRQVVYSDPELARRSAGIVLGGSITGLTVDEALGAVLPTCGLTHRTEDGRWIILPAAEVGTAE